MLSPGSYGKVVHLRQSTMDFIIKFAQAHETFRVAEIQALAITEGVNLEVVEYSDEVSTTSPRTPPPLFPK